jgi:hypothetical protein
MTGRSRSAVAPFRGERNLRRAMSALAGAGFAEAAITTFSRGHGTLGEADIALRRLLANMPPAQAEQLMRELDRGGSLLFVRVHDASEEKQASLVLLRHSPGNVHVHDFDSAKAGVEAATTDVSPRDPARERRP